MPTSSTRQLFSIKQLSRPACVAWFDPFGKRKIAELLAQAVTLLEHFPVVPLKGATIGRNIFQHLEQNPKAWSGFFARIAGDPELQREMLQVISQHPEAQNDIIILIRIARSLKFRGWLLKIATKQF